jgi:glycosyltransferase involved in cell wall biosynthesis
LIAQRAQLYESVRTVHLERASGQEPTAIVYRYRRYDFDESLTVGIEMVQASPIAAARLVARSHLRVLEINEPLMLGSLPTTALALFLISLRGFAGKKRPTVVTYAIGNDDPFIARAPLRVRTAIRRRLERILARYVWRHTDRIAFGTEAARLTYAGILPQASGPVSRLIPALPAACALCASDAPSETIVFLGAFSVRKGFDLVLASWAIVSEALPSARLQLLGKGPMEPEAIALASRDERVSLVVDPPRSLIHDGLRSAQVLVLPSQSSPTWREQVGLPIVEALSHGCSIVTTEETGLASWLEDHGHSVVPSSADAAALAEATVAQLRRQREAGDVLSDLPATDGRLAAENWLVNDEDSLHASASEDSYDRS